jgi:glycosyltransferase involved in cell wall biosynthesis
MTQVKKPVRILLLVGGAPDRGLDPSSRFRVFFYLDRFAQDNRFSAKVSVSWPAKSFHERSFFKRHRLLRVALLPLGLALMFARRLLDVVRAPFYDVVFIQRPLLPGQLYPILELAICRLNRHVVFDFDDAIFVSHHEKSPERSNLLYRLLEDRDNVARIIRRSAHVVAGNEFLADFARQHNPNISVVPTAIDTDHYMPGAKRGKSEDNLVVGWIGTSGNLAYVERLAPVFRALQQRIPFELRIVCNPVERALELPDVDYDWRDWEAERELADLSAFDIGIMPLPDNVWERGKCGFKLLQYMACGIPAIVSPVGVNRNIVDPGENGLLAAGTEDWESRLEHLLLNPELRQKFSRNGRETVLRGYALDITYPRLADALLAAAGRRLG